MKEKVIDLLKDINPFIDFEENTDLIEEGILDSAGIMVLLAELETTFDIKIEIEEIEMEDFLTIQSILNLVERIL